MFKFLRKKIQSLTETQQNILTVILILINLGIFIFWISFWVSLPETITPPLVEEKPTPEILEPLKPGEVGEISEEGQVVSGSEIAFFVQNTTGTIQEIKEDRIIVQGDGQNFADRKPRILTIIFTENTITQKLGGGNQRFGFKGLEQLKPGMNILISAVENIRGKIEFKADIINIL